MKSKLREIIRYIDEVILEKSNDKKNDKVIGEEYGK